MKLEALRSLVRPFVTFFVLGALTVAFLYLIFRYGDHDMAERVGEAFLVLSATLAGYWFGSRTRPQS